jgi:DNA-binding CsgD family transcriptional regulator
LTATELAILGLLTEGLSNLGIAKRRGIQEGTVKIHLSAIYRKLGVESRTQAARIAERLGKIRQAQLDRATEPGAVLDWLLPYVTCEHRRAGEILFRRGEQGNCLYFVQRGRVQLSEIRSDVADGELLGEVGVFSPSNVRTCTARCETDVRLFRLSAEQARRLYFENPQLAYHIIQLIAERLSQDRCMPAVSELVADAENETTAGGRAQLGS